jgi:hypothetical protein
MPVASDSSGSQKYWDDGIPFIDVRSPVNTGGLNMRFWTDGITQPHVFPGLNVFASALLGGISSLGALLGNLLTVSATLQASASINNLANITYAGKVVLGSRAELLVNATIIGASYKTIITFAQYMPNVVVFTQDVCTQLIINNNVLKQANFTEYTSLQSGIISCTFAGTYSGG